MEMKNKFFAVAGLSVLIGQWSGPPARAQAVAFQPVVTPFPSGVTLDVTPAVSADRRYVRMSMGVSFTSLLGFDTYSVPAAVSGGGMNGAIGGLGGMGMGGGAGAGGGGGLRAAGIGETRAAGVDQTGGFGEVAGDPFARAAEAPSNVSAPADSRARTPDSSASPSARPSRARVDRGRGQGSTLARKTKKYRTRTSSASEGTRSSPSAEPFPEVFPFDP